MIGSSAVFDAIWEAECDFIGLQAFMGDKHNYPGNQRAELFDVTARRCHELTRQALRYHAINPDEEYIDYSQHMRPASGNAGEMPDTLPERTQQLADRHPGVQRTLDMGITVLHYLDARDLEQPQADRS